MFQLHGTVERETEKAVLFSAIVLYTSSSIRRDGSRVSVWFPKSRIAQIVKAETERAHDRIVFGDESEWLLRVKEADGGDQFVFIPFEVQ